MKIKLFCLSILLFLSPIARADDDPVITWADWKFDGRSIKNCPLPQDASVAVKKVSVPANMQGTFFGTIEMDVHNGHELNYLSTVQMQFAIYLGPKGIQRFIMWPKLAYPGASRQPFRFPNFKEIVDGGACADQGYDADLGFYVSIADPELGAEKSHWGSRNIYRIEVKPLSTNQVSLSFNRHGTGLFFFFVQFIPGAAPLPYGDYLFEDYVLNRQVDHVQKK